MTPNFWVNTANNDTSVLIHCHPLIKARRYSYISSLGIVVDISFSVKEGTQEVNCP